jgi:hypothetical protein
MQIQSSNDLLSFLISQSNSGVKSWFGFQQQRIVGIHIAYEIAKIHANTLSPDEIVDYVAKLNNAIYYKLIKNGEGNG